MESRVFWFQFWCYPLAVLLGVPGQDKTSNQSPTSQGEESEVDVVGCLTRESGKLQISDEGNVHDLLGHAAELRNHVGDEMDIIGMQKHPSTRPTNRSSPETNLKVTVVETVLHKNPLGVRPLLGHAATLGPPHG
jgi:hypothetical protein